MNKWNFAAACLFTVCALSCCGCGDKSGTVLIGSAGGPESETPLETAEDSRDSGKEAAAEPEEREAPIRVYVCGAVANPGVVEIPQGSRVEDALEAAGGFAADAGQEAVNLADWVSDGQKLYFPTADEALETGMQEPDGISASGLVNINTADIATLCTLPGIGESRAKDIVSYREANGGFASCEDIMKVAGIKTAVYEKISDKITVK